MKKLPLWKQSFVEMKNKENDYIYIDKTKYILNLIENKIPYFLSRPRRFWKSLLIDTIRCLFEWKKKLFKWLYIYDKWDWKIKYPVIKIVFWEGFIDSKEKLIKILDSSIKDCCIANNLDFSELESSIPELKLKELIYKLYKKTWKQVVVLIDEYDKPILDQIKNIELAIIIKDEIKWFYSVLKWADEYLKFVMLTWVTKFSKVSVFSWLNNLNDITIQRKYNSICWYTIKEIQDNFWPEGYLKNVDMEQMKVWYNGYSFWDTKETVYNPFGILNFFTNENIYQNYWFTTATPTFLIKLIKTWKYNFLTLDLEKIKVWNEILDSFDIEKIWLKTLLFQSWYLTIKEIVNLWWEISYTLWVPNEEVRKSLNNHLIKDYLWFENTDFNFDKLERLYEVLWNGNIEWYIQILKEIFAWIPYSNYTNNDISKYEWFYGSVLYSFMAFTWIEFIAEDFTNKWRIDFTMKIQNKVYIIELKVEKTWKKALKQIQDKKYSEKYLIKSDEIWEEERKKLEEYGVIINTYKKIEIYLVWINFNKKKKNIDEYEFEKIER